MIYLTIALDAEARPFIELYRLKRDYTLPYTLYVGKEMILLITQMGKINAMMAMSALLGWRIPRQEDILLNIGICGAPTAYPISEALLIHQIIDGDRRYYPDILFPHPLRESSLVCADTPQNAPLPFPADMESAGLFQAASRFFKLHQMAFLKIVSDHFEPEKVTKELAITLVHNHIDTVGSLIQQLQTVQNTDTLFTPLERQQIEHLKTFFTKSQSDGLEDALNYFRLKSPDKRLIFPDDFPDSKRERSALLEKFIAALTL